MPTPSRSAETVPVASPRRRPPTPYARRVSAEREVDAIGADEDSAPRSGSSRSRVTTIIGLYQRAAGGWLASSAIVQLAEAAGVGGPLARTALTRLKKKGLLLPERRGTTAGYALSPGAIRVFDEGDRRILQPRNMRLDDPWCVVSFSVPESQRALRSQLRRRLSQIGFGPVASALWIGPDFLRDEVTGVLSELDVRAQAVLFTTPRPIVDGPLTDAVARWWDLDAIAAGHRAFADTVRPLLDGDGDDPAAFARFVVGVDAWRPLSFLDPGLPYELLPADWPGRESAMLFHELKWRFAEPAQRYVDHVLRAAGR